MSTKTQRTSFLLFSLAGLVILSLVVLSQSQKTPPLSDLQAVILSKKNPAIYFSYHISNKRDTEGGPFTENANNPLLDGAIINVKWSKIHTAPETFEWGLLDKKISDWTAVNKKQMILKVAPYGQEPLSQKEGESNDNETTPEWIYETVPRITFTGGGKRVVSVPKVWDSKFYPEYEKFLKALAEKYNKDPRIGYIIVGPGMNGTILAQGSRDGGLKFIEAGWTVQAWEQHIKTIIDIYKKHFRKPLMLFKTSAFLNDYNLNDYPENAKNVLGYAAMQGVSILFRGLDPDEEEFNNAFNPELVTWLGTLNPPKSFKIGFGDDWPMWVPPDRSNCKKGPTCGRDEQGLIKEFEYAYKAWDSINRKYPAFFMVQLPEATATNQNVKACQPDSDLKNCFHQPVYDIVTEWISTKSSSNK